MMADPWASGTHLEFVSLALEASRLNSMVDMGWDGGQVLLLAYHFFCISYMYGVQYEWLMLESLRSSKCDR